MTPDGIEALAFDALRRCGAGEAQAASVARSIRRAEEDDIGHVGLGYLPTYLAHLRGGKVRDAVPAVTRPRPGLIAVDAAHGFAHPAFDAGLPVLVQAARENGVAAMAVTRSCSIGVLGHPVEDVARHGLVALGMTNSPPNMAVWGGRRKQFGTNPIAFALPRGGAPPLVVDMATTAVTKVALAARAAAGQAIPEGWAMDAEGRPTTDARAAMAGAMLPFGGDKGANVAFLVEVFAAVLTGAALSRDVQPYAVAEGPPPEVGQFMLACDPDAFAPGFADRLHALASGILAEPGVRLPGERRLAARARAMREGIAVAPELLARIEEACR